ncbi:RNA-binding protein [Suicoccus acidiformans]|uniref:RNA-binding protein KhpA n=1 Tax=Suicoccus acidiformans TaxID=2036206 RepID=A0A347WKU4_9LACT|nr:KH domain-containing protein [Suicoccus acidiformans]AXY25701.1 RNA-binding protein [Suicoccus acidiformans]
MPNIIELITSMVTPLIEHPEDFSVEVIEGDEFMEYHLNLNPEDIGRVIGRKGRVIRSIRTIVYSIRPKGEKRSRVVVAEGEPDQA